MSRQRNTRLAIVGALVAGALVVAAAVTARGGPTTPATLEAAIASEPLQKVTDLPSQSGAPRRSMFVQQTSAGFVCTWVAETATSKLRQGECNPTEDPLVGRALWATLTVDGGPALTDVRDARLIGLAAPESERVVIEMTDGSVRDAKVRAAKLDAGVFQAFAYRIKQADLKAGVGPVAVVAYDAAGRQLGHQETGIG